MSIKLIDKRFIPYLNKAMGFELTEKQILFLTRGVIPIEFERREGVTTARIIRILMKTEHKEEPIIDIVITDMDCMRKYCDFNTTNYWSGYFLNEMREIHRKLYESGLPVRELKIRNYK